jgi:lysozyme family protein
MTDINALKVANASRWKAMHTTPALGATLDAVTARLIAAKRRYQTVEAQNGVPWFVIAVIHERESSQSWAASLAQGDPWNRVSVHVPRGRGPFLSWEAAAEDALENCAPFAARWEDWSIGGLLTLLEEYNGLGYAAHGVPSPYVWASTDQYKSGKYVADGHYDPNAIDHQLGCAALISRMMIADKTIAFAPETPATPALGAA